MFHYSVCQIERLEMFCSYTNKENTSFTQLVYINKDEAANRNNSCDALWFIISYNKLYIYIKISLQGMIFG